MNTLIVAVVVVVVAVVGTYLFLRNNPNKRRAIDRQVDRLKKDL